MGWDIGFHLRFADREPPVSRFARAYDVVCAQPGTKTLCAFEMARRPASGPDEKIELKGEPADDDLVRRHLAARLDEPGWLVQATWIWEESVRLRDGSPAVVGEAITVAVPWQTYLLGAQIWPHLLPPGGEPDLVVDAFDYRRYFPRAGDQPAGWDDIAPDAPAYQLARLKIDALVRRLVPIVELGAESLWGMRGEDEFSPKRLYAVFHRDLERYRDDNVAPPLPDVRITNDVLETAARDFDYLRVSTSAGPIIYHPRLGYGALDGFYWSLRSRLEAKGDQEAIEALEREIEG